MDTTIVAALREEPAGTEEPRDLGAVNSPSDPGPWTEFASLMAEAYRHVPLFA
jgi:hypothetical protein